MNRVCLTGRLTRDPELRELSSGQDVVKVRIAVDNGRDREPTFVDVAQFVKGAGPVAEHLSKGRYVEVDGRLNYNEWEAQDGTKRSKHEVIGSITFGPDRARDASNGDEGEPDS